MFNRRGFLIAALCLLACFASSHQQQTNTPRPLVFEFEKADLTRVKIYWDPSVDVKKIKEISNRDVRYVINNATGKVREEYSPWLTLVTEQDDVDPTRRLLFVKSDLCVEQDYRVSWFDSNAIAHENVTQRMEPSPEPWKPSAKIELANVRYDGATKHIMGNLAWAMSDEKLKGIPKLGSLHPTISLESCRTLFDRPVPLPVVDPATKIVSFDPAYAKHECTFSARLRQMTYNGELECRSLRQTVDEQSDKIELSCLQGGLNYPECKENEAEQQPCAMTCDQQVTSTGDYDWSRGWPRPFVKVEWKPRTPAPNKAVVNHLVRYAQIDSVYNNYPIEEFNVSFADVNANTSSFRLDIFSKDPESFYAFQVCTLYEACFATAKWSSVPKHAVFATAIADKLPPPPPTTTAVPPPPSTPAAAIIGGTTSEAAATANGTQQGAAEGAVPRRLARSLVEGANQTTDASSSGSTVFRADTILVLVIASLAKLFV